jgi:serine protease Do
MRTIHTALPLLLLLASAAHAADTAQPAATTQASKQEAIPEADLRFARNLSKAFRQVARMVQPSVVSIHTVEAAPAKARGAFVMPRGQPGRGTPENGMPQRKGLGTGFILRDDGTIVTNNHVVRGAQSIRVRLSDGREFDASILGADPETDVAVLHIDAKGLPAAKLMESKDIEVGDWVLALGSPFGLEQTVTAGIISAKGRDHVGLATFENYLQTDAAINPGNSGGPLCSLDGAVVGMNTAIGSGGGGGNDGVGFAIPMEMVKRAADALVQDGRVRYGYIGVLLQEVPGIDGAVIGDVVAGGPADKAGLQPGDVIVQVDGVAVNSRASLTRTVGTREPGTMVKVHALRNGEDVHAEVKLAVRPTAGVAVRDERGGVLQPNR